MHERLSNGDTLVRVKGQHFFYEIERCEKKKSTFQPTKHTKGNLGDWACWDVWRTAFQREQVAAWAVKARIAELSRW